MRIAAKAKLSQAHISDLELGRRELTPAAAEKLGPALGVDPDRLMAADVLAGLKAMTVESPDDLDARLLVEIVEYLDGLLPANQFSDGLLETLLELASERIAAVREQRVSTKSRRGAESTRDAMGRRRKKPYGLGGR